MSQISLFNAFVISLPLGVTIFYTLYLSKISKKEPALAAVSKRTSVFLWFWFLAASAIAYFRLFPEEVSFQNGDVLTFSLYVTLLSFGPIVALLLAKRSDTFFKLLLAIPAYVLVASQIIRLGGYAYWEAYKAGEIPFSLGLSVGFLDVFLALCSPILAFALYKKYRWASIATVLWAGLGIFDVLNAAVQMSMGFVGIGGLTSASIHLPLSNLIELYQVGIGIIIHVHLIHRFITNKKLV